MVLLGKKIKELRNDFKFTQTELADKLGITKSTVAAYENDSRQPSYEVLIKMSKIFKVSIDDLLLNHPGATIEVHGLSAEQLQIIEILIAYFRKNNAIEDFFSTCAPELQKKIGEYLDKRIDNL